MVVDPDQVNLGLLVLRTTVGATMVAHGVNHVVGGGRIAGTARWFARLGMHPGLVHAWLASLTEILAGSMLVAGLLTPLAAGACAGVLLVAWITNHRGNGFFIFRPGEGWEYVMNLCLASLVIAALGPGEWSLDEAVGFELDGWRAPAAALAISIGGTVLLLATTWRPGRQEPARPAKEA